LRISLCETADEFDAWDGFLQQCEGASYWQLYGWLSSYGPMGLTCEVMTGRDGGEIVAGAAFLSSKLPLGAGSIFLLPHGPVCAEAAGGAFEEILAGLNDYFARRRAIYVQVWPHVERDDAAGLARYARAGYTGAALFHSHEFSSALLAVDIGRRSEEQVLADARRNTRYYGRASRQTGLELRLGTSQDDLTTCYQVWAENGDYHNFPPRPLASYRVVMERLVMRDRGVLLQAWHGSELAGAIMVLFVGRCAVYAAGAIRRAHSERYPAEFLHLEAMRLARERGLLTYDFNNWGSEGTAQFKRGFRPVERCWAGARTRVMRPALARLVSWGEDRARPIVRKLARWRAERAR